VGATVVGDARPLPPFGERCVAMRWRLSDGLRGRVIASGWLGEDLTLELEGARRLVIPLAALTVRAPEARWSKVVDLPEPAPPWLSSRWVRRRTVWWELPLYPGMAVELEHDGMPRATGYREAPTEWRSPVLVVP
jgi:hypothetical protein